MKLSLISTLGLALLLPAGFGMQTTALAQPLSPSAMNERQERQPGLARRTGSAPPPMRPSHCPGDTIVWLSGAKLVYLLPGAVRYGKGTGAYACRMEADGAGFIMAEADRRPWSPIGLSGNRKEAAFGKSGAKTLATLGQWQRNPFCSQWANSSITDRFAGPKGAMRRAPVAFQAEALRKMSERLLAGMGIRSHSSRRCWAASSATSSSRRSPSRIGAFQAEIESQIGGGGLDPGLDIGAIEEENPAGRQQAGRAGHQALGR